MKKDRLINIATMIIVSLITSTIAVYASNTLFASNIVSYDNTTSGIRSGNVQEAIDELYACASDYSTYNTRLTALENNFLDRTYPVGSIYISVTEDTVAKVKAKFGGEWIAFGQGRTLIGVGTGTDSNSTNKSFSVNSTGGEYNHTLTVDEMPRHSHFISENSDPNYRVIVAHGDGTTLTGIEFPGGSALKTLKSMTVRTEGEGKTYTHNNIQPYITVYMWKRTA